MKENAKLFKRKAFYFLLALKIRKLGKEKKTCR